METHTDTQKKTQKGKERSTKKGKGTKTRKREEERKGGLRCICLAGLLIYCRAYFKKDVRQRAQ